MPPEYGLYLAVVLPDGPLDTALLGAALCLLHALPSNVPPAARRTSTLWWAAAGLCAGLALFSKYSAILTIGGAFLYLLGDDIPKRYPKLRWAFVEASAVGWREYLHGDPRPADALILKANPDMTEDILAQARDKMRQHGIVDGGDAARLGYGAMTDQRWADFFKVADKDPGAYKDAYTLQVLPNPPVK